MEEKGARYSIEKEIGRGAFGVVYLAHDSRLERSVALKVMSIPEGLKEDDVQHMLDRFYREARAAASLSHPNIVIIHDISKTKDRHFISMEFLEGEPLVDIIARDRLPVDRALLISDQVLAALEYAHDKRVVHRDIKPDNIFVLPGDEVKLVDFGLARVQTASTMTRTGTVMGSPGYISPEVIEGRKADERTDIFSFGVVLYEMLTGERPFGPKTGQESFANVIFRILQEDPAPPSGLNADVSPELDQVLAVAMAKDPDDRYQDVAEFRQALAGVVLEGASAAGKAAGTVLAAGTASIPRARPASRTRVERAAAKHEPEEEAKPAGPRRRLVKPLLIGAGVLVAAVVVVLTLLFTGVFSGAGGQAKVPNLINLDLAAAKVQVRQAGLRVGKQQEAFAYDIWKGKVSRQFPVPDTSVPRNSTVDLWVSLGNDVVAVPDVVGRPEAEAQATLESFRFKVARETGYSDTVAVGVVMATKPAPNIVRPAGEQVLMTVCAGPPPAGYKPPPTQPKPPRTSGPTPLTVPANGGTGTD